MPDLTVFVELHAARDPGALRVVTIPQAQIAALQSRSLTGEQLRDGILGLAFLFGQNDRQPKRQPSVSAGDIIRSEGKCYLVQPFGFAEVPAGWHPATDAFGRLLDTQPPIAPHADPP